MFIDIAFFTISGLLVAFSAAILFVNNIYRSAVFLAFSMLCFAAMYFIMSAEFIGVIQILVYVGAVSVLIALSVMLVKDIEKSTEYNWLFISSIPLILVTGILFVFFIINFEWNSFSDEILSNSSCLIERCQDEPAILIQSTYWLGKLITADFMIAFQVTGLILVSALIGALSLLRIRMGNESD